MTHTSATRPAARSLAPDLARGWMLLLIALANVPWFLYAMPSGVVFAHPLEAQGVDLAWQLFSIVTIDGRSYPLFAFLFGYGIWQLYSRQAGAGTQQREAKRLLQRRHVWMIAFGAVHALLLWYGDIVGAYGLIGLLVVWLFLDRADRTLRIWCLVLGGLLALAALSSLIGAIALTLTPELQVPATELPEPNAAGSYLASVGMRMSMWFIATVFQPIQMSVPLAVLLGILAARHRLLDDPGSHRKLLTRIALLGIAVGWLGGAVSAAQFAGWTPLGADVAWGITYGHHLTGVAGGIGYAAAFGLAAHAIQRRGAGPFARALQAVGKRSLSNYLGQSLVFAPLLCAWGFGLGAVLSPWQAAVLALVTWLILLGVSAVLEQQGKRGPAEWLLRRLAYGKRPVAPPAPVAAPAAPAPTSLPG
ncbi:MAG: DUF418 domain-containing protein [Beutenbergiaceae bacterium]